MTPQERQLIDTLFDRLASVENNPRDAEAQAAIADGLRRAPNAVYALVQTVLVQEEALARANAHIEELEQRGAAASAAPSGSFLDSMRDTFFGQTPSRPATSVPRTGGEPARPAWNTGAVLGNAPGPAGADPRGPAPGGGGGGGSFLGTAAAAAAGVVGGSLLMNSIRGLMGGGEKPQSLADASGGGEKANPWGGDSNKGGDLARDAGLNVVGAGGRDNEAARAGQFDNARRDQDERDQDDDGRYDQADYDGDDYDDDFGDFDDTDFG